MEDDFKTLTNFYLPNYPPPPSPPWPHVAKLVRQFALQRNDSAPKAAVRELTPKLKESGYLYQANYLGNRQDEQCQFL